MLLEGIRKEDNVAVKSSRDKPKKKCRLKSHSEDDKKTVPCPDCGGHLIGESEDENLEEFSRTRKRKMETPA